MAWPNVYTYNFCPNPSFELDLTGVTEINGAGASLDITMGLYGTQSLLVSTPGQTANEGVILPPGTALDAGTACVSFYLQGNDVTSSGTLNVYAIDTTSGTTLGTTTVSFDPTLGWQQVVINGITLVSGHSIAVYVETAGTQQTAFNIDGIQYEPSLTLNGGNLPTPYIDGDQDFGFWVGTAEESASYKLYQFQLAGSGSIRTYGDGALLDQGAIFYLVNTDPASGPTQIIGNIDLSGRQFQGLTGLLQGGGSVTVSGMTTLLMYAGLDDFAIFSSGDVDPAISLVGYNNAGISTGTNTSGSAGYTRPYATFSAPRAFQGSTGKNVWNNAAYFAIGYELASLAAGDALDFSHVQAEVVPYTGSAPVPSTYIRPRALTATLAPTRLNYVPNPSFEVATGNSAMGISDGTFESGVSGWIPSGATVASSTAQAHSGTHSALLTNTVSGAGTQSYLRPDSSVHVVPGYSYSSSSWVFTATAAQSFGASIDWRDSNNNYLSTSSVAPTTPVVSTWTQVSVTGTAPAGAAFAVYGPTNGNPSASTSYYVDDVTFSINQSASTLDWYADAGTPTMSLAAGGAVTGSNWSAQVVTTVANTGIYTTISNLIVGETYTASAYVQNTSNASANTGKISVGATNATVSMPQNTWVRVSVTFTATASNVLLDIQTANTGTFLVDAVMLEVGSTLNAYGDGSFSMWNWENPALAGLSRSYYYERGNIAYAAVQSVLSNHLPLGLHAYAPVYNSPPTQYS